MLEEPEFALAHHNNLLLNDRVVFDNWATAPVDDNAEGDRLAELMGDKSIMVMGAHGVTVVGATVHEAFDECYSAERTLHVPDDGDDDRAEVARSAGEFTTALERPVGREGGRAHASRCVAAHPGSRGTGLRELTVRHNTQRRSPSFNDIVLKFISRPMRCRLIRR